MATVPAGLASLTQAVTDLTTAVNASVARLADLAAQLTALNSEDPAVQAIADTVATLDQTITATEANLQAALPAPAPTPAS